MLIEPKYCLFNSKTLLGELTPAWQEDKNFLDLFSMIHQHTLLSPYRLFHLYQYARNANFIHGDFAQVGILKGGSAKLTSLIMSDKKNLFLFDTFEGLPETNAEYDLYPKGRFNETHEADVRDLFKSQNNVKIYKGIFPHSTQKFHAETSYAFVYLDVDIFDSNLDALQFFYPRLSPGGVILIDDYEWNNTPGIKTSVDLFIKENALPPPIITTKYQCLLIKN